MDATHTFTGEHTPLVELQQDKSFLINNSFDVVLSRVQCAGFGLVHHSLNHTAAYVHSCDLDTHMLFDY